MTTIQRCPPNKRNKVLHRFYEPLVLLHVLDTVQGDRMPRQRDDMSSPNDASKSDLRRRFLDSLAYICDHEKGGDTMTAIFISTSPLTYHLACNKAPSATSKLIPFLRSVLDQLGATIEPDIEGELQILARSVQFSEGRVETYKRSLQIALRKCLESSVDAEIHQRLQAIENTFNMSAASNADLCRSCFALIKSQDLNIVRERATRSEDYGNGRNPFAELRHFIGRLGNHVQVVKVFLAAAKRFPLLFKDFDINVVKGPVSITLPPPPRSKLTLFGIVNRMVGNDQELTNDLHERLEGLDRNMELEQIIRKEYGEKGLKPRVHAELILLEYYYRNRDSLEFYDNDRYIGASKPACYCCYLYFREHPGEFVHPATHQKVYLNWLPPTSTAETQNPNSETAIHERTMLNIMVKSIRKRTIEQLKTQTGGQRRQRQFDSVTWDTLPKGTDSSSHGAADLDKSPDMTRDTSLFQRLVSVTLTGADSVVGSTESPRDSLDIQLSRLASEKLRMSEPDDTDDDGGVLL